MELKFNKIGLCRSLVLVSSLLYLSQTGCSNLQFENILLIINYNHAHYESIPFINEIYAPYFPNIVFYGPEKHEDVFYLDHYKGFYSYLVISDAIRRFPQFKGYLFVHDDCIIHPWCFSRFSQRKIWAARITDLGSPLNLDQTQTSWGSWSEPWARKAFLDAYNEISNHAKIMLARNWGARNVVLGYSDITYIPQKYCNLFVRLADSFGKHKVFLELAIPTLLGCLAPKEEWEIMQGTPTYDLQAYQLGDDFFHPIKLSSPENRSLVKSVFTFMQHLEKDEEPLNEK